MKIEEYIHTEKMSLDKFLQLDIDQATSMDFLTQGDEPDRCELIKEIYQKVFPWYDEKVHAGDTLNTYRTAIKKYYGNYYRFLSRERQLEILEIIKKYVPHDSSQIFEFEDTDANGKKFFQICNNYQLGNFGILPIHGGINPKRAASPYLDYFDKFVYAVYDFYTGEFEFNDNLSKAIQAQADYFNRCGNINEFVYENFLDDFFENRQDENGAKYLSVILLSEISTFEQYVRTVAEITGKRGQLIWGTLQKMINQETLPLKPDDELSEPLSEVIHEYDLRIGEPNITEAEQYYEQTCNLSTSTNLKLAKIYLYSHYLAAADSLVDIYQSKVDDLSNIYRKKLSDEKSRFLKRRFTWTRWWYWPILFLVGGIAENLISGNLLDKTLGVMKTSARIQASNNYNQFGKYAAFLNMIFIGLLILKIIYNIQCSRAESILEKDKEKNEADINNDLEMKIEQYNKSLSDDLDILDNNYSTYSDLGDEIPSEYRNIESIQSLELLLTSGRADNFKEAYELLENQRHRDKLEREAELSRRATENAAEKQIEMAREQAESMDRRARAAEREADEVERHNRELELNWKK